MFESACGKAQAVVLDQVFFTLDADRFRRFTELLDAPPLPNPGLDRLEAVKPPWTLKSPQVPENRQAVSLQLGAPEPLTDAHSVDDFTCGELTLDDWADEDGRVRAY